MTASIRDQAFAALEDDERKREAAEQDRREQRAAQERQKDQETLAWVYEHEVSEWFPDVRWVLVDRRFPQQTAVIHAEGEPDIRLIVTKGDREVLLAPEKPEQRIGGTSWLAGTSRARTLAELGRYIRDREHRAQRAEIDAEDRG